jgi:hypothetical protein
MSMRGTILVFCVAALIGCEESTMVGSGCPNGACPEALVRDDDVCVVTTTVAEIAHTGDPDAEPFELCLPAPLERSEDGTIRGNLYFVIIGGMPGSEIECTDRAFLKPVTAEVSAAFGYTDPPGTKVCEVLQLPVVTSEDGGVPIVGAGDGFYYDDFSAACGQSGRILFTRNAHPWEGVIAKLAIADVRDAQGEADETLTCEPVRGTEPLGAPCSLPQTEYFDSQAVIATNVDACGQGVCIAYHLEGRTDVECTETSGPDGSVSATPDCASPREIEQRMYCTCRCDGPPGATDLCDCPDSFSCVDVVTPIVPSVAGSYCVRNNLTGLDID